MLKNCLVVTNAKGGVGKTSIVANLAASAAAGGWRVLAVDLDPQGNLARDLGYWHHSDDGAALAQSIRQGNPPAPACDVRPGLDVLAGGHQLAAEPAAGDASARLAYALQPLHDRYDLIVLDTPPAAGPMQRAALGMAAFALVPTKIDDASIDGLEGLAVELADIRTSRNPDLQVVGVVMFDVGARDHRLRADARTALEELLGDIAPVLQTTIRHSRRAARDLRRLGRTCAEYEHTALTSPRWIDDPTAPVYSSAATGLADDYQQLADEVLAAIAGASVEAPS